jgi:hypothetical protein
LHPGQSLMKRPPRIAALPLRDLGADMAVLHLSL